MQEHLEGEDLRFIDRKADAAARVSPGELQTARGRDAAAARSAPDRLARVLSLVRGDDGAGR